MQATCSSCFLGKRISWSSAHAYLRGCRPAALTGVGLHQHLTHGPLSLSNRAATISSILRLQKTAFFERNESMVYCRSVVRNSSVLSYHRMCRFCGLMHLSSVGMQGALWGLLVKLS